MNKIMHPFIVIESNCQKAQEISAICTVVTYNSYYVCRQLDACKWEKKQSAHWKSIESNQNTSYFRSPSSLSHYFISFQHLSLSLSSLALSLKLTVATTTSQSGHVTKAIKWVPSQTCVNVCSIAQCKQLANHLAIDCSVACICLGLQKQVKKKKAHIHIQIVTYRQQYLIQTVGTIIYYYTYFTFFPSFIVFLIIDK